MSKFILNIDIKPIYFIDDFFKLENKCLDNTRLIASCVGYNGAFYGVIALNPLDYRETNKNGTSFSKNKPDIPQKYRIFAILDNAIILDCIVENEKFNIHYIQPLENGFILVSARCFYSENPNSIDNNGRIYDNHGNFIRGIVLGDGISDIQTHKNNLLWVSYFDEGIFGNYGWNNPLGRSGLVQFDVFGNKITQFGYYQHENTPPADDILDCYAINVVNNNNVWCYYYDSFSFVHLVDGKITSHFENNKQQGGQAFAVGKNLILLAGGYGENANQLTLFNLSYNNYHANLQQKIRLNLPAKEIHHIVAKGENIFFVENKKIYQLNIYQCV